MEKEIIYTDPVFTIYRSDYVNEKNINNLLQDIDSLFRAKGINLFDSKVLVDTIGRMYFTPAGVKNKKLIGVIDNSGKPRLSRSTFKKPEKKDDKRTSVTFFLSDEDYEEVARAVALSGKSMSAFVRDILMEHYLDV